MKAATEISIEREIISREKLIEKIHAGEFLMLAADESQLVDLPAGNWIAGTIPYFMTPEGGMTDKHNIFVHSIKGALQAKPQLSIYDLDSISQIAQDAPEHGFSLLILPALSEILKSYAKDAPYYPNMYMAPIVGWVAGTDLSDNENRSPKVGFGPANGMLTDNQAVAIHLSLPEHQVANINTVNLFKQGEGPDFRFSKTAFQVEDCETGGSQVSFSQYIKDNKIDTRLPLVANLNGVMINVSIQQLEEDSVSFYAPVLAGVKYRFAKPIENYIDSFNNQLPKGDINRIAFSCNCIANYFYAKLEGKKTGSIIGPMTFGEVAYQLLNQTLVYLTLTRSR
jgi:hypothetical protein